MGYIVHTRVDLKFGQNAGFNEVLVHLKRYHANHGWTLIYGLQPLIGKLNEVIHVWEVETLDGIASGLNPMSDDPEMAKQLARLPDFMNTENVQVMVRTPYSP